MPTKSSRPGRPALGAAKRRRMTLSLKPDLVRALEARAHAAQMASSRMVEELLEAGLQAKAFQDGLWEARLGRSSTEIAGLCKALGIKKLSLFGSVLRDDFRPDSDVDILAEFFPGTIKSFLDRGRIQMQLQRSLGRRVDLAEPRLLDNPIRRAEILRTAREIYAAR